MFEYLKVLAQTPESTAALARIGALTGAESRAAAARLVAVADLFAARLIDAGERAELAIDTESAVAAEVAAAMSISIRAGESLLCYARAMRERLPRCGARFSAGEMTYAAFRVIVDRTVLITDAQVLAAVDARVAAAVGRWASVTTYRLRNYVDTCIAAWDREAVRRSRERHLDRYVKVGSAEDGLAYIDAQVSAVASQAVDRRLNQLADTVCAADPRTRDQRRADAMMAMAAGAERLYCSCGRPDCPALRAAAAATPVVIHVVADRSAVAGTGTTPGVLAGADALIPAALVAALAGQARQAPVLIPTGGPEPHYVPSQALADFVRSRDLTCRAPGCDRPAEFCDIDHTIPYGKNGPTHAGNLKCLCRKHHLLKTFGGWLDEQLADGTVIWTLPGGRRFVTLPGSALLFPQLCVPTPAPAPASGSGPGWRNRDIARRRMPGTRPAPAQVDRCAAMPRRKRTRAENRTAAVLAERRANRRELHRERQRFLASHPETAPPF